MIIGHLPAGYVASRLLFGRLRSAGPRWQSFVVTGMLGAVAPDFDMLYFHFVDHGRHHHHTYVTHWPIVWGCLLLSSIAWLWTGRHKAVAALATMFSLNGFIHMFLDSIVGDIRWFAPFSNKAFSLFTVQPHYQPWWLNFVLHWTFALELALVAWALMLWRQCPQGHGYVARKNEFGLADG